MFTPEKQNQIIDLLLPFVEKGANFKMVVHLDLGRGTKNKTRVYVDEMIKPGSFVASKYANR